MTTGPFALVLASNTGVIAALSVASLVIGYGLLAGLWYFVFSPGAERRAERRRQARGEGAVERSDPQPEPAQPEQHAVDAPRPRPRRLPIRRR